MTMRPWMFGALGAIVLLGATPLLDGCASPGRLPQRAQLSVTMTGVQEVPGPGDQRMTGHGTLRVNTRTGETCWDLYARGGDAATAAHIHRGAAGIAGPIVIPLATPGADGHSQGCTTLDLALARELVIQPYGFYANVHTGPFPNGATRGQLRSDGPVRRNQRRDDD